MIQKLALGAVALSVCAGSASATVLTFDRETGSWSNEAPIPQDYGDNVAAGTQNGYVYGTAGGFTPNVAVNWNTGSGTVGGHAAFWASGFGNLANVIEAEPEPNGLEFSLVAEPGWDVVLHGFDMAGWGNDYIINFVRVTDGNGNVLFQQDDATIVGHSGEHTSFDFATPLRASTLRIAWDSSNLNGASDNVAMDNITFGQTQVPEPSTLALAAVGALVAIGRRRRGTR